MRRNITKTNKLKKKTPDILTIPMKVQRSNYYYWLEETHLGRVRIHKFICMVSVNVFFFLLFWGQTLTFHIRFARTFWLLLVGMLKARCLLLSVDGEAQHGELLVIFMKPLLVVRRPRNITLNYQLRLQNYPSIWCIWLF